MPAILARKLRLVIQWLHQSSISPVQLPQSILPFSVLVITVSLVLQQRAHDKAWQVHHAVKDMHSANGNAQASSLKLHVLFTNCTASLSKHCGAFGTDTEISRVLQHTYTNVERLATTETTNAEYFGAYMT